jgi:hypothetical protein
MGKKVYVVAGLAFLVVALASFGVYARGMMGKSQSFSCDRADLLDTLVKDSRGDLIGIVYRVENDGGQSFAIINHGLNREYGEWVRYTPVPVGALKIAKFSKSDPMTTVVINKTEKQLKAAPSWDPKKMNDHTFETKIDSYFGTQPSSC